MTNRYEAKNTNGIGGDYFNKDEFEDRIDEIYDDFESRVCENCKYWEENINMLKKRTGDGDCHKEIDEIGDMYNSYTSKDFGCNKFEPKIKESQ